MALHHGALSNFEHVFVLSRERCKRQLGPKQPEHTRSDKSLSDMALVERFKQSTSQTVIFCHSARRADWRWKNMP